MSKYFNLSDIPNNEQYKDEATELTLFLDNIKWFWSEYCRKKQGRKLWFGGIKILPPMTSNNYNGYRVDIVPENGENKLFQRWLELMYPKVGNYKKYNKIYFVNCKEGVSSFFQIELKGDDNEQQEILLPLRTE